MSTIGGILLYVAGVATGAGLLALHLREVQRAVKRVEREKDGLIERLRASNARLRADADSIQRSSECADAFRRGKERGQKLTDAERFARRFEKQNVKFVDTSRHQEAG